MKNGERLELCMHDSEQMSTTTRKLGSQEITHVHIWLFTTVAMATPTYFRRNQFFTSLHTMHTSPNMEKCLYQ